MVILKGILHNSHTLFYFQIFILWRKGNILFLRIRCSGKTVLLRLILVILRCLSTLLLAFENDALGRMGDPEDGKPGGLGPGCRFTSDISDQRSSPGICYLVFILISLRQPYINQISQLQRFKM